MITAFKYLLVGSWLKRSIRNSMNLSQYKMQALSPSIKPLASPELLWGNTSPSKTWFPKVWKQKKGKMSIFLQENYKNNLNQKDRQTSRNSSMRFLKNFTSRVDNGSKSSPRLINSLASLFIILFHFFIISVLRQSSICRWMEKKTVVTYSKGKED